MTTEQTTSRQGFTAWLREQQDRDDPVGDLARESTFDPNWPGDVSLDHLVSHIGEFFEDTLRTAYAEYQNQQ